jgi:hypothetical protein
MRLRACARLHRRRIYWLPTPTRERLFQLPVTIGILLSRGHLPHAPSLRNIRRWELRWICRRLKFWRWLWPRSPSSTTPTSSRRRQKIVIPRLEGAPPSQCGASGSRRRGRRRGSNTGPDGRTHGPHWAHRAAQGTSPQRRTQRAPDAPHGTGPPVRPNATGRTAEPGRVRRGRDGGNSDIPGGPGGTGTERRGGGRSLGANREGDFGCPRGRVMGDVGVRRVADPIVLAGRVVARIPGALGIPLPLVGLVPGVLAGRVHEVDGVVLDIAEPVQALGVGRLGDDGVGGNKPPQGGIVVPGAVVVQPRLRVLLLPGVAALVEVHAPLVGVRLPEGEVAQPLDLGPLAVGEDVQAPQVVPVAEACPEPVEG